MHKLYKFLGKKGQMYKFDLDKIIMKLNYRCEKGTVEADSFSCGKTPEERKKNYEKQQKVRAEKQKGIDERRGNRAQRISSKAETKIAKITDPKLVENVKNVRSLIDKAKSELASGKVSKQTYKELRNAVNNLKSVSKPNSDNVIEQMKPGEIWNAGPVGDIKIESIKGNNITVTANGKTETMSKSALHKALKEYTIKKIDNDTSKTKSITKLTKSSLADNHDIKEITSKLNEVSQITDPIERQQFISDSPKLKSLEKYQTIKEREKRAKIKDLKNEIKTLYKNEKDPKVAEKKELEILNKLKPLQEDYKNSPIENWEDDSILEYYSSEHYATVNKSLDTKNQPKKCAEFTSRLNSIINSNKTKSDITTFRGISDSAYDKLVSNGMKVGSTIECPRFTSTSKNIAVAYDFAVSNQKNKNEKINIIKCDIPKGTPAMDMTKHVNSAYYEEEILLNSGQKFKIENIEENEKYRIIHWKVIQ